METAFRLITFASCGNLASLEAELASGSDLNSCDYDQRTAFHIAAANGQLEVVQWFMHQKVPYKLDRFGCTPQSDAIRNNHYQLQKLFQEYNNQWALSHTNQQKNPKQEQMEIVFELLIKENIFNYSLIAKVN
jgi:ankyrin repeat protein